MSASAATIAASRMMGETGTIERPKVRDPRQGHGDRTRVIVLNDDHNTFQGVAAALARYIPGVSYERGMQMAVLIHTRGSAVVWTGQREVAELYWQQLRGSGLTMAPLE